MPTLSEGDHDDRELLVAQAVADPVLMRLEWGGRRTVLVAADMIYEKEGEMRLQKVRWCDRHGIFSVPREACNLMVEEVRVRRVGDRFVVTAPSARVRLRQGVVQRMGMTNLTRLQYDALRAAKPRCVHATAEGLIGGGGATSAARAIKTSYKGMAYALGFRIRRKVARVARGVKGVVSRRVAGAG